KGAATAFAGNNIDGAEVQYRVVRKVSYPYLPWYWRRSYYDRDQMEIANGRTTTDENGQFSIEFEAIPNAAIPAKDKPQFRYEILADVTDINGETQSTSGQVIVGYIALQIGIDLPEKVNRDSLRSLTINSLNLNNEFEGAKGKIRIEALQSPGKVFRKRLWQEPDQYLMTKEEFEADFPNDVYKKEDQPHTWPIANSVYAVRFNTNKNKELELDPATWPIGHYKLTLLSKDKYGQEVKLERLFILYDLDDQTLPSGEKLFNQLDKPSYEPGMLAKLTLGAEKSTQVFYELIHNEQIIEKRWLQVKDMQSLRFPIVEAYRGNLHYRLTYVLDNRFNTSLSTIIVPWTNKDLKFEYLSFRDQLQPGAAEEWQIKISGMQKDRLAAEMVATLYDASLDQFTPHNWQMSLYPQAYTSGSWQSGNFNLMSARLFNSYRSINYGSTIHRQYRRLKWFNFGRYGKAYRRTSNRMLSITQDNVAGMAQPEAMMDAAVPSPVNAQAKTEAYSYEADEGGSTKDPKSDNANPVRTNLKETVFFIPDLQTDAEGNILLKFKMNEALTRWNFMGMAHTQALEYGFTRNEVITQKELMVQPNAPRFLREGDEIEFTAKVSNLTEATINGQAELQLFDALSMQPVDELLGNTQREINFSAAAGQSDRLAWRLKIPEGKVMAITHRVIARAGSYADGEESSLPVLTNRMMVTESLPLPVSGKESKTFVFKGLEEKSASSTLKHHRYTLEFTSNPAWYAVQALPYMMEYPYQCTEQVFNRFYANSLATSVANAHPKIKRVFEAWKNADALQSNLSKNQALKSALIEETPWVLQAQSEAVQKKNIGLLFDLNRMSREQDKALNTLLERQQPDGSFSWFPGGRGNWYITQYLVEGMGHLDALGTGDLTQNDKAFGLLKRAIQFIDQKIVDHYERLEERLQKKDKGKLSDNHLDQMAIHYLYARSFFADLAFTGRSREVRDYYLGQAEKYWLGKGNYLEGMLALALHRFGQQTVPAKIIASLRERAMRSEELGMYWKSELGYYWYQLPIEQHALMIELFDEVAGDAKAVNDLKVWLLKNKQTTHWQTTKATSAAVYALLRRGNNWLLEDQLVKIEVGGQKVATDQLTVEAGTGYFKTSWKGEEVNKEMSTIKVENPNEVVAWGGVYWQYFEQLDKITSFEETPLKLKKQLFLEKRSDKGPVLQPIDESVDLKPGDKLKVRIELRVDRAMEYVHLKDMRASGLEPINVLSQYKWQGGLGYYESTRDLLTSFFFDYLPKGTFVFEYPLRVSHTGNFSNGISTIQCMYAPEFSSHSEGIRLEVGEK
ncbi:MAG: alpha-2-macroglobulin family protein, partial [Bacteroidota bacterium]